METRTVGDCFYQIRNGANIKQGSVPGGYPITRIETIANDKFNRDRMGYAGITDLTKYESYVLEDGDLLMSHINSVQYLGRTVLYEKVEGETVIHGMNLLGLKANRDVINPAYARYFFYSLFFREQLGRITKKSVNQASFTVADLKKIKVLTPSLEKQAEIVNTLNRINNLISKRKDELQMFDDLIKARFVEMFGSVKEEKLLGDISEFVTVGIANSATHAYAESGIPMLRNQNIKENHLDDSDLIYIKPEFAAQYESKKLRENDIIAMRTGYPGIACLVPKKYEGCQTFTTLIVRLKAGNNPRYVCSYINSDLGRRFIDSGKVGVAQQNFGAKSLAKMPIKIAPKEIQDKYAEFVAQVDKSKVVVQKALDEAQLLFDSLMQQYFG